MQPFDTDNNDKFQGVRQDLSLDICAREELRPGNCSLFQLPDGNELAVYNIDGEYYAIENFCPHRGARLSDGVVCGHIVECGFHGWQFDMRTGECLTVQETIGTHEVRDENGMLRLVLEHQEL
jgi:nitrite reductase/ring-hydroxylating ferredoxin subunit